MAQPTHFHDYITVVTDIDRKKYGKRIVPMKVLCLGFDRTGTTSLLHALKLLGINDVYHGWIAFFENPRDCDMWKAAYEAKYDGKGKPFGREEFDQITGHCQAIVGDVLAFNFAEELIAAYPEAKVILTTRPVDEWHRSHSNTLLKLKKDRVIPIIFFISRCLRLHTRNVYKVFREGEYHKFDGKGFEDHGKMKFGEHYDLVRSLVRPDRLLELRLGDGWGPLCEFLIVERPKVDYPRTNDTATASKRFEAVVQYTMWLVINRLLVLGLTFGGAVYFLSRLWQLLGLRHFGAKMWEANTLNE